MFSFFKRKFNKQLTQRMDEEDREQTRADSDNKDLRNLTSGMAVTESYRASADSLGIKYQKPETYTGNRTCYDSGTAKKNVKLEAFKDGEVIDPYTNKALTLTRKEAKLKYGKDWQNHVAEADHIVPLKKVHSQTKDSQWNTVDEIKDIANSKDNLELTSRKINNAKRFDTNEEFVNNDSKLNKKEIKLSEDSKRDAIKRGEKAQNTIDSKLFKNTIKNVAKEGHAAGMSAGKNAGIAGGTTSAVLNIVSVIKGEKNTKEAVKDIAMDTGKSAAVGYVTGGGLTVLSHSLSNSSSTFIQSLAKSNVPGQIITAVMVTGSTLSKFAKGEISTEECVLELGEKGLTVATAGYSAAIGQMAIPIPVVGAVVGALAGSMLTSSFFQSLVASLKQDKLEHQERMRIIEECERLKQDIIAYQTELENYLESYFKDYQSCFDEAFSVMHLAIQQGDSNKIIQGANMITNKMGGTVKYENVNEFKKFLDDETIDVF